jgi:uncharacterized membrane protein YcfT
MKSIAHAAPAADVHAAPKAHSRNVALDRARTFLTLVVLLHHAVIPYTYFGHTDPTSWIGFDCVVLATDSFFMAMFFFLSGLFVWPGLGHKPWLIFLRDRLVRLGLPFVICALRRGSRSQSSGEARSPSDHGRAAPSGSSMC